MRLGAVPYLNALPLIHGLPWEVRSAPPATLDRLLKIGKLDLATAPIVTLFENPNYSLVPGVAIGCRGPVKSVRLIFQKAGMTLGDIGSLYLDMESKTSAMLLKVLLHFKYKMNLQKIRFDRPLPGPGPDAVLLIGNKAMQNLPPSPPSLSKRGVGGGFLDLGEEWTSWTGLPFVFAAWLGPVKNLENKVVETLITTCEKNLSNLETLPVDASPLPREESLKYLTENVSYRLGDEEIEGLIRFHSHARELGLIGHELRLHFYPPSL
ncbi:MAG: menaquinone biosynthesis protein [Deltaproteobacteria bacterium]|nr:menaquinone biosynthesis protein [Deltaproteobacteria bacterium]